MSDFTKRLRQIESENSECSILAGNCADAIEIEQKKVAIEIARLRADNEKLQWELGKALDTLVVHDAVCAENEKLRAALKPFAIDIGEEYDDDDWFDNFKVKDHRAAAAALNDKKNDNK